MLSEARRRTAFCSPRPIACDTTAVVPVPRAKEMPMSTMVTGKVKLIAANSRVPSLATKYVSARLKPMTAKSPPSIGTANLVSVPVTGSSVSFAVIFIVAGT